MSQNLSPCNCIGTNKYLPNVIVGRGNVFANIMFIGEAPGATEDKLKKPFVGRSGILLEKLLKEAAIDSERDLYICNVLKCRPPNNRKPTHAEIEANMPWLLQQIYLVDPKIILVAGATAIESILGLRKAVSKIRGTWQYWQDRLVMPLFHPSYLLRNPSMANGSPKFLTQKDLIAVRNKLEILNSSNDMSVLTSVVVPNNK